MAAPSAVPGHGGLRGAVDPRPLDVVPRVDGLGVVEHVLHDDEVEFLLVDLQAVTSEVPREERTA